VSYRVVILRRAQKELEAIPSPSFEKVEARLLSLRDDPRPPGCKKMKDREGAWRIRSGDYRIIYDIDDSTTTVTVFRVGHRKEIYQ
jgi:mRNA interferase RelE/StbE